MATEGILGIAQIPVRAVLDQLDQDLALAKSKTEGGIAGIAKNVQKLGGLALAGIGAGVVAIGAGAALVVKALSGMVEEAMASQEVQAQLNAVLASTGGIAGVTADKANELAESLMKVTRFDDEAILGGESLLLTFTNIGKNVFPTATQTMLDMSTVLKQDLPSSARMLGRALNDPVAGMSALTRVGITFSEEQKNTIKALVEAGKLEEAQGIILDALSVKFGGAAVAAGQTFAGQMDILKNRLGNVREEIGGALLPVAGQLMDWFGQAVDQALPILIPLFEQLTGVITNVVTAIEPLVQGLIAALGGDTTALVEGFYQAVTNLFGEETTAKIQAFVGWIGQVIAVVQPWIEQAAAWIGANVQIKDVLIALGIAIAAVVLPALWGIVSAAAPIIATAVALIAAVTLLRRAWESDFLGIRTFVQNTLAQIASWWAAHGDEIVARVQAFMGAAWSTIQTVFGAVMTFIQTALATIQAWWAAHGADVMLIVQTFMTNAWNTVQTIITAIQTVIQTVLAAIQAFWSAHGDTILAVAQSIWGAIQVVVQTAMTIINQVIAAVSDAIKGDWTGFGEHLRVAWDAAWEAIKTILNTAWTNIKTIIADLIESVKRLFRETDWGAVARGIIDGIANGIRAGASRIADAARAAAAAALAAAKGFLGISSPSTAFRLVGQQSIEGWARGLSDVVSLEQAVSLDANASLNAAGGQMVQFYGPVSIPGVQNAPGLLQQLAGMA